MYALIDKASNTLAGITVEPSAYDLALYDVVPIPDNNPDGWIWNGTTLVARPARAIELTGAALDADPRWAALKSASPAQIDTWLDANVTDLASARRVLKILCLAIQLLARTR